DSREGDRSADPERPLEAAGQCSGSRRAGVDERLEVRGRDRGGDRDADRPPDLLRGVEQPRGEAGLLRGDAGERRDRYGDEGEGGAGTRDEEGAGKVVPEAPVDRCGGGPEDAA